jgi:DNA polymerase-1
LIIELHVVLLLEVPDVALPEVRKRLPEVICGVAKLKVPLVAEVGVGNNWEEAH